MRGRGQAAARALGALALTLALVVGVPALLLALVGNPLPGSIPSVDEIRILLTQNGQGFANFIIGTLAVLIWIMWAQLVLALVVEAIAVGRQSETRRLPTLPGIQGLAARLIAAMTLATALAAGPLLAPAVGALNLGDLPVSSAVSASSVLAPSPASTHFHVDTDTDAVPEPAAAAAAENESSLVVSEHTELWDLADSAYGDGVNWKLIANANAGVVDASGALITDETESVAPGTELRMPGTVDMNSLARYGAVSGDAVHIVKAGDSMWTVAEHVVESDLDRQATNAEVADYWVEVVDANANVTSGDVDLIYPGDELVLPATAALSADRLDTPQSRAVEQDAVAPVQPAESSEAVSLDESIAAESSTQDASAEAFAGPEASSDVVRAVVGSTATSMTGPASAANGLSIEAEQPDDRPSTLAPAGLAALGAAMLSAGVIGALRRRRDLQRRTRPEASIARRASSEAEAFETALRQSSHQVRESKLGLGWRMVPASAIEAGRQLGPLQVHCDDSGRLRAVAVSSAAPVAFDAGDTEGVDEKPNAPQAAAIDACTGIEDSDTQTAPVELEHIELDASQVEPGVAVLPTSLLIGTDSQSGEAIFFDLGSTGSLGIAGEHDAARRFARTAVLDLAVSERADDLCLIAVDVAGELEPLERVHTVGSFADALAHAVRSGHARSDSTTPVVIVSATEPADNDSSLNALRDLGAVIIAPNLQSEAQLVIAGPTATLLPSGTVVELAAYQDDDYRSVAELVGTTSPQAMQPAAQSVALEDRVDVLPAARCLIDAGPIEVKVLGPVEVAGASAFSSLKAVDVVAFLAFHRNGVDGDQIKTWVWPAYSPPTDKAFANVMSRARTGLGAGEDGAPFLSRAGTDRTYRLSTAVTTDFDRFRAIVDHADAAVDSIETVAVLKHALELIRGVPFTGGGASSFAWADNHVRANVEFTIDETVHRCADLALEVGDLETARWAALKGLELVPGCEQCFRRRFLVAAAGNNRSELRRAMADLERVAAAELGEPEAVDHISDDLLELYHQVDQTLMAGPQ